MTDSKMSASLRAKYTDAVSKKGVGWYFFFAVIAVLFLHGWVGTVWLTIPAGILALFGIGGIITYRESEVEAWDDDVLVDAYNELQHAKQRRTMFIVAAVVLVSVAAIAAFATRPSESDFNAFVRKKGLLLTETRTKDFYVVSLNAWKSISGKSEVYIGAFGRFFQLPSD